MTTQTPTIKERFFILTPTPTDRVASYQCYLDADGLPMLWSNKNPLPSIGDKVEVTMNGIGMAIVKGYFVSWGGEDKWFLGVMALPIKPPKWYKDQHARDKKDPNRPKWMGEGIGCFFGSEIKIEG